MKLPRALDSRDSDSAFVFQLESGLLASIRKLVAAKDVNGNAGWHRTEE